MRCLARTSLGMLSLALIAPMGVSAQDLSTSAPAGYGPSAPAASPAPVGPDGKPLMATDGPAPAPVAATPAPAPHQHSGRTLCARCAAKQANAMPPGKIVGCAHSRNGVCTACQAALNSPGQFVVMSAPAPEVPGRAVASKGRLTDETQMAARSGRALADGPYASPSADPMPVGVVQANYMPVAPLGMPAAYAPQASAPGRAVAESPAGHDPYQAKGSDFPHPHILGHLFGWSGIGSGRAEEKARRKSEAHAMIRYEDGSQTAAVDDLPASMVYGKKGR